jgi:hypothetical protein
MSEILNPKSLLKFGVRLILVLAAVELLGFQNWVTSPVASFKKLIGQG